MTLRLLSGLLLITACTPIYAFKHSSVDALNINIEKCFQQSQVEGGAIKRHCNYVIRSEIATRENRATAFHNRAVIHLNNGDISSALKDFDSAYKTSNSMADSLLAAKQLRKNMMAKAKAN